MGFKGKLPCILIIFFTAGCVPRRIIVDHPQLISTYYFEKQIASFREKDSLTHPERRKLLKLEVEFAYGFILEEADRLFAEDYQQGLERAGDAYSLLKDAIKIGTLNLTKKYPEFEEWLSGKENIILFEQDDIYELYWLAAAYGGAIRASRGNPFELIQLPRVGKLLKAALRLDADWNHGALYSAMISYTATRSDLVGDALIDSVNKYYVLAVSSSDSMDAGPFVSFAENIDKKFQHKSEFIRKLEFVSGMNINQDQDLRLGNIIAQERAKWLLTKTDEYFFE